MISFISFPDFEITNTLSVLVLYELPEEFYSSCGWGLAGGKGIFNPRRKIIEGSPLDTSTLTTTKCNVLPVPTNLLCRTGESLVETKGGKTATEQEIQDKSTL